MSTPRDFLMRAPSRAAFEAAAENYGLLERDRDDALIPAEGVLISHCGPQVLTPPVMSEDGMTMLTAPVMDQRWHVNLRIVEPALSALDDQGNNKVDALVSVWAAGAPADANAGETATAVGGIEWVRDVSSQSRVWE